MSDITTHPIVTGSPETIWLNYGDLERDETHANCIRDGDVTWCEDSVFVSDVKYVRADRIIQLEAELEAERNRRWQGNKESSDELREAAKTERELRAHIERIRAELNTVYKLVPELVPLFAPSALAATPAQSLARHNNEIREKCATLCESLPVRDDDVADECAAAIRAMKEPE